MTGILQRNAPFLGKDMLQHWTDVLAVELALNAYDGPKPLRQIVELGTYNGRLSLILLLQAIERQAMFLTVDRRDHVDLDSPAACYLHLRAHYIQGDVFSRPIYDIVRHALRCRPVFLLCDNGNKSREVHTFVPFLTKGDLLGVHDWGSQVVEEDIAPFTHRPAPHIWKECEEIESTMRFWKVVA